MVYLLRCLITRRAQKSKPHEHLDFLVCRSPEIASDGVTCVDDEGPEPARVVRRFVADEALGLVGQRPDAVVGSAQRDLPGLIPAKLESDGAGSRAAGDCCTAGRQSRGLRPQRREDEPRQLERVRRRVGPWLWVFRLPVLDG